MKHRNLLYLILLFFIVSNTGCMRSTGSSHIAAFNALVPAVDIDLQWAKNGKTIASETLSFGKQGEPRQLEEGQYEMIATQAGDTLLRKKLGIGKNSNYEVVLSGLVPDPKRTNQQSTHYRWLYFFEGATEEDANAELPRFTIQSMEFHADPAKAQLSLSNFAAGSGKLELVIRKDGQDENQTKLAYPQSSDQNISLDPGNYNVGLYFPDNPKELARAAFTAAAGDRLGIYIVPDPAHYLSQMKLVVISAPGREG